MNFESYFSEKVCVITGAASGLGLAMAQQLAKAKALVVMTDINQKDLEDAADLLKKEGYHVTAHQLDVCDASAMERFVETVNGSHHRIDLFINSAGITVLGEIRDLSLELWRNILQVNVFGTLHGVHHVYPLMIGQKSGHIVNIASGFGLAPGPMNGPYVTSKFAVVGLSEVLRAEAKDFGIDVTVVCPGFVDTRMVQTARIIKSNNVDFQKRIPVAMVKVDKAACIILQGIMQKKARLAFPFYVQILATIYNFLPRMFFKISLKQIRQFRRIRRDGP